MMRQSSSRAFRAFIAATLAFSLSVCAQERREITIEGYTFDPAGGLPAEISDDLLVRDDADPGERHWRILQFATLPDRATQTLLRNVHGLGLDWYLQGAAYVENVTPETVARLQAEGLLRWSGPFQPAFKLSRFIGQVRYQTEPGLAIQGLRLRAVLFDDADLADVRTALGTMAPDVDVTGIIDDRPLNGHAQVTFVLADPSRLNEVANIAAIKRIEEVGELLGNNAGAASLTQSGQADKPSIWSRGLTGKNQVVGMIDTGPLDMGHCFFRDDEIVSFGPSHRKLLDVRGATTPPVRHATFMAGILAGDDVDRPGEHDHRGGAWAARLVAGNYDGLAVGTKSLLNELTLANVGGNGAYVHSNSWAVNNAGAYDSLAEQVDQFTWDNEEHLVLAAVTPKLFGFLGILTPAISKNAVAVSAAQSDPMIHGEGADGPAANTRRKPDLTAVGCAIVSAVPIAGSDQCPVEPYENTSATCGTSEATAEASAAAVLAREYFTEGWYPFGEPVPDHAYVPSGALLKATLLNSARDMTGVSGFPNDTEGWGVITLDRTLRFPDSEHGLSVWDVRNANTDPVNGSLFTGEERVYAVSVTGAGPPLKVSLVWNQPAGENANNDLDLEVIAPDEQTTYRGNHFAGGYSTTGGTADTANNVEQVMIEEPSEGDWTIRVIGTSIPVAPQGQGFAVVATGPIIDGDPFARGTGND